MRAPEMGHRTSYLRLAALQDGLNEFAEELDRAHLQYHWRVAWARWAKSVPGEVVLESGQPISTLTLGEVGPDQAAVPLGVDGAVQAWSLPGRELVGQSATYDGSLDYVAFLEAEGKYWIVGVWTHPEAGHPARHAITIRVLKYPSCELHADAANAHSAQSWRVLQSVCAGSTGRQTVLAVAAADDAISLWSVPALERLQSVQTGHSFDVCCMAIAAGPSGPLLIASFDACRSGEYCDDGVLTRAWTVPRLSHFADHYCDLRGAGHSMALFTLAGEQFVLIEYLFGFELEILDSSLQRRHELGRGAAFDIAGAAQQGNGALVCGDLYRRFCYAKVSLDANGQLTCGVKHTRIEMRGDRFTAPARVHGRLVLASVDDATRVRLWDVDEMIAGCEVEASVSKDSVGHTFFQGLDTLTALAVDPASSAVLVGATVGTIAALDAATGSVRWERSSGLDNVAAAIAEVDGRQVVVFAGLHGALRMFDIANGVEIGPVMTAGSWITSVATAVIDTTPVCIVTTNAGTNRPDYRIVLLDLRTGEELRIHAPSSRRRPDQDGRLRIDGYEDKTLERACVTLTGGQPVMLAAGPYSFVRKWNWPPGETRLDLSMQETVGNMYVHSLAAGTLAGRPVAAAGNERGLFCVWDLESNALLRRIEHAHEREITAVAILDWFGSGAVVTGGSGYVRLWSSQFQPLLQLDFDARIVGLAPIREGELIAATEKGVVRMVCGSGFPSTPQARLHVQVQ
jgi:WD40 repeat protein